MNPAPVTPVVLVIGGNDPLGGAGLCADIQALARLGCHAAPVVTAITRQTTCGVRGFTTISPDLVSEQIACVLEEMPVAGIKTGMLASPAIVASVDAALSHYPDIPLVVDPVFASNRGDNLSEHSLLDALVNLLVPRARALTPNLPELQALAAKRGMDAMNAARLAADLGIDLLVTGTHDTTTDRVVNRLYQANEQPVVDWQWERLPGEYHGSGCTLASALIAGLAHGLNSIDAATQAQEFTWQTLRQSHLSGQCQRIPNRTSSGIGEA